MGWLILLAVIALTAAVAGRQGRNPVANLEIAYITADLCHLAYKLVTQNHGHFQISLVKISVHVTATDTGSQHFHFQFAFTGSRFCHFAQLYAVDANLKLY